MELFLEKLIEKLIYYTNENYSRNNRPEMNEKFKETLMDFAMFAIKK